MRPPDEHIPPEESLYRGVTPEQVEGDFINEKAIDLQGTSVQRSTYASPESVRVGPRTGVAALQVEQIPPARKLANGVEWEWFVVDNPSEEEGEGHAELRARRTEDRPSRFADKPKSPAAKVELRILLAQAMVLLQRP